MKRPRKQPLAPTDLLSLAQVGWYLGKSYNQVARLVAVGELPATRRNNRWVVLGAIVTEYLKANPNRRTA